MKHFQALKNLTVQLKYGRCQQVQTAMAYMGSRMRGGEEGKCLEDQVNAGVPLGRAMDLCSKGLPFLTAPDGTQTQQVNVVQQTLHAAGATPETQTLAKTLLGDVTLRTTGGRFDAQASSNPGALLALYEANRGMAAQTLDQALEELRTTGQVSDATMQQISVPGQPIPRAVLDALLVMSQDPTCSQTLRQKLATAIAVTQLQWQCDELQDQLQASVDTNPSLTDDQRRLMQQQVAALQRKLRQTLDKIDVVNRYMTPAMEAILTEYSAIQHAAVQHGLRAPATTLPTMPFRRQQPSGYSQ